MENSIATINQGRPVYFSYARNSSRKPEWEHISDCVDPLLNAMTANGLEYRVDVKDIGMGDKISKFEEEIGWNSEVVVIIFSDKYFRSMHCMYEFVQIKRALETYPEKRLMCIKSGDFNLSDVNYISDLERYWGNQKFEYENIEYHRLREHSGTEIAAYENGFYLDEIRNLYSFFSAINYSNANSINYYGFVGDIVKYYRTTRKPKLTPKPKKTAPKPPTKTTPQPPAYTAPQPPAYTAPQQPYVMQLQPTPQVAHNVRGANTPQRKTIKIPIIRILILAMLVFGYFKVKSYFVDLAPVMPTIWAEYDADSTHTYVDLGLPSGTLWATCNIGANAPEEYGDYFYWYGSQAESDYNWCMPTQAQFQELYDECKWIWTIRNGKNGYDVKGPNNNSIFLPAAGLCSEEDDIFGVAMLSDKGTKGEYWSSSEHSDDDGNGSRHCTLYFKISSVSPDDNTEDDRGRSVRPVRCK